MVFGEGQTFLFPRGCYELKLLKFGCQENPVPEPEIFGPKIVKKKFTKTKECIS